MRTTGAPGPYHAYAGPAPAPYLSREAAALLVERGIETLVLDLPSADRADDGGKLTAHRVFFGLPPGSRRAGEATRPRASITELAWIPPEVPDGLYLLDLQLPAFASDAAPSRPRFATTSTLRMAILLAVRLGNSDEDVMQRRTRDFEMQQPAAIHQGGQHALRFETGCEPQLLHPPEIADRPHTRQIVQPRGPLGEAHANGVGPVLLLD